MVTFAELRAGSVRTNSEANSMSADERMKLLDSLVAAESIRRG